MKQVQSKSSTGGTTTEFFNENGVRVKVLHTAGKAYSGKAAEKEQKVVDKNDI
jgi:hypothetical protein